MATSSEDGRGRPRPQALSVRLAGGGAVAGANGAVDGGEHQAAREGIAAADES